jgi:hypothetical protein
MSEQGNRNQAKTSNSKNKRPYKKRNNRKFSGNKNRRPKSLSPSKVGGKYDNLMEQYVAARKKFYDIFGRGSEKQVEKAKAVYDKALNSLRDFEKKLEDWQKEILEKKVNGLPPDRQYTTTNNIEPVGDTVAFIGDFEDPHLLDVQKSSDWSEDTEESSGSMDDYYNYKGVTPPPPKTEEELKNDQRRIEARRNSVKDYRKDNNKPNRSGKQHRNNRNKNYRNKKSQSKD